MQLPALAIPPTAILLRAVSGLAKALDDGFIYLIFFLQRPHDFLFEMTDILASFVCRRGIHSFAVGISNAAGMAFILLQ